LGCLTKSQTFNPTWPEIGLIIAELEPKGEKVWFSRAIRGITLVQCIITTNKLYFYSKLEALAKNQTFRSDWPKLALFRAEWVLNRTKTWLSRDRSSTT